MIDSKGWVGSVWMLGAGSSRHSVRAALAGDMELILRQPRGSRVIGVNVVLKI